MSEANTLLAKFDSLATGKPFLCWRFAFTHGCATHMLNAACGLIVGQ
jgi:hypothetical protein